MQEVLLDRAKHFSEWMRTPPFQLVYACFRSTARFCYCNSKRSVGGAFKQPTERRDRSAVPLKLLNVKLICRLIKFKRHSVLLLPSWDIIQRTKLLLRGTVAVAAHETRRMRQHYTVLLLMNTRRTELFLGCFQRSRCDAAAVAGVPLRSVGQSG